MAHIVIIGNGITGTTAARHIRKQSNHEITIISAETDHFFSRTALMYIYMGHMKYEHTKPYEDWFWEKNKIKLVKKYVQQVNTHSKEIVFEDNKTIQYDKLILAVGSKSNKFGWPGQDLKAVQGLYSYQDLESMEKYSDKNLKRAVIIGGGLIGIEMAEMFLSRNIEVTFLVRENSFWNNILPKEESEMITRHIKNHHVDLRLKEELKEVTGDENGRVKSIITQKGEEIPCQFVGLTIGVSPNIDFLKNTEIAIDKGILVNEYLETNIPDVYAAGDCAQFKNPLPNRRPVEQVWYTGKIQGETLANTICGKKTIYNPGTWFNSAKFFDIEYQTYGWVWNQLKENESTLYWEHPEGGKSIRINYSSDSKKVLGFNLLGIRYRQETCVRWIEEGKTIAYVLEHLSEANFDPEFFKQYERELVAKYNLMHSERKIELKSKKGILI